MTFFDSRLDQVPPSVNLQRDRRDKPINLWVPQAATSIKGRFGITLTFEYVNQFTNITTESSLSVTVYTPDYDQPSVLGKRKVIESSVYLPRFTGDRHVYWTEKVPPKGGALTSEQIVEIALLSFATAVENQLKILQ